MIKWIIHYALWSTVLLPFMLLVEERLRDDWRETGLWTALLLPALMAFAALVPDTLPSASASVTIALRESMQVPLTQSASYPWLERVVFLLWTSGACAIFIRDWSTRKNLMRAIDRQPVHAPIQDLAERVGIHRTVRLSQSPSLPVPIAIGASEVCVPSSMLRSMSFREMEPILLHELAHLRRRDPHMQLVARCIATLLWWQPLNRQLVRRLASAAELRADMLAARVVPSLELAQAIVGFIGTTRVRGMPGVPAFASGLLTKRIELLLSGTRHQTRLTFRFATCVIVGATAMVLAPRFELLRVPVVFAMTPVVVSSQVIQSWQDAPQRPRSTPPRDAQSESRTAHRVATQEDEVIAALSSLLHDPEPHVRAAARSSLERLSTPASKILLENNPISSADS